jgi:O-antigen ligase
MISQSRGVWLALVASLVFVSIIYFKSNRTKNIGIVKFILISISISIVGGAFFKDEISNRASNTLWELKKIESGNFNSSIGLRLQMWLTTPSLIKENILIGSGDKHKIIMADLYDKGLISSSLYKFNPTHYHNQLLDKLVKSGIIGFIIFCAFIMHPVIIRKKYSKHNKLIVYGILSIYILTSLTDVPFNHPQTLIIFLLILFPIYTEDAKNHD